MKNQTTAATLLLLFVAGSSLCAKPVDLGSRAKGTPYDRYMAPVKSVLAQLDRPRPSDIQEVRKLMRVGRGFRYAFDTPYVANLPHVTAKRRAGDCKDKALWLADQLGDENVRFVIGKARASSKLSHAWLYWKDGGGKWWILDCTYRRDPIAAEGVSPKNYIPLYSYAKGAAYRHAGTATFAAVATGE